MRQITQKKSDYEFLTPISYITGLQNLNNSTLKVCFYQCVFLEKRFISLFQNLKDSPVVPSFQDINEPSPLKEDNWQQNLQKNLFTDAGITDSQVRYF